MKNRIRHRINLHLRAIVTGEGNKNFGHWKRKCILDKGNKGGANK
jgi:hypothetical protein